jgi:two-component system, chemotaxis family, chemotaxis protein CheY
MADMAALDILIVDDDAPMRAVIERSLRAAGAGRLRTAESGPQALALLAQKPADLIITDQQMPEMPGLDFIAAVRADAKTAHARVLMITGYAEVAASAPGVDAVLMKPIEAGAFAAALEKALR